MAGRREASVTPWPVLLARRVVLPLPLPVMSHVASPAAPGRPALAFVAGAGVGLLGGLIGLGGAEFRLPLLLGLFALAAHQAVRVNLLVSLATVCAAALARFGLGGAAGVAALLPEIAALTAGAVAAAWVGAGLLARLSAAVLARVIAGLLALVALILLAEAAFGLAPGGGLPAEGGLRPVAGVVAGLGIGAISSLLGVAGGEFLIPTFMLAFGAEIRTAGTASLLVSLPTVAVGVARFARQGAYRDGQTLTRLVLPMAFGSMLGATAGAALLPHAPAAALKVALGLILAASAVKLARKG
jgi:hypothetical protein